MPVFTDSLIANLFGNEDAENESPERLKSYFFKNKAYDSIKADLPIRIIVGHKGIGKSALLKISHLEDVEDDIVSLWIQPNDIFTSVNTDSDSFLALIENWKIGISTLIVKKILEGAEKYDEANKLGKLTGGLRQVFSELSSHLLEGKTELGKHAKGIAKNLTQNKKIRVYLDDLDRGWQARPKDIRNISALLNAVRDMAGENSQVQFRIGLRTDVYHLVRTSDESTDKIESNIVFLRWTNHEILVAMVKRIATFFDEVVDERELINRPQKDIAKYLDKVIEPRFKSTGHWSNAPIYRILLSLTRKRPRDLIKIFTYAAKEAYKYDNQIITSGNLESTFVRYSTERLQDIVNEFKTELKGIEILLLQMKKTKKEKEQKIGPVFTEDQLITKLKSIQNGSSISFTNGKPLTAAALAEFLYKTDFITARIEQDGKIVRMHYDENQNLLSKYASYGFKWEIHPAYRWALEPKTISEIIDNIQLSGD